MDSGMGPQALDLFHPIVQEWFLTRLGEPSEPQRQAWPLIAAGRSVLVAAPTGSGKTLTAFLWCIDRLFRLSLAGELGEVTHLVYVSPLKALSNDVEKNLLGPLREIQALAESRGLSLTPVRAQLRTGDTPQSERAGLVKHPPHILITTPESLYLYLTSPKARLTLSRVDTVIVDEIHALARDKRGAHLALSLERLRHLAQRPLQRIGLSATQKPLDLIASFLMGTRGGVCVPVEVGQLRPRELGLYIPDGPLTAVASAEMWAQVFDHIAELSKGCRTVLVFVNTRRWAERMAHQLAERVGKEQVCAHHGSLSKEIRLDAEARLKAGQLKIMVATASLELGLDIGAIDLVIQIGSPRSIGTFLQRVGRAGHYKGGVSRGLLVVLTRDDLVECSALIDAVGRGELDHIWMPETPLDVLSQQIVAMSSVEEWGVDALFELVTAAWPYRNLSRANLEQVLDMLGEGVATGQGRSRTLIHRDRVGEVIRGRKGSSQTALLNGGTIPDVFDYPVVAEPESRPVGTVSEDFAVESLPGDVFLLGSSTWQILSVRQGVVRVASAEGMAPTIPFWEAQAPSRTRELSAAVGRLRSELIEDPSLGLATLSRLQLPPGAETELQDYLRSAALMLGGIPCEHRVILERFFDEVGGIHVILHAPFGGRINRAWGLALRKRFCRSFDFELQAAANDDGVLLSLGEQHSFPLTDLFDFLQAETVEDVLTQAILQTPLFGTRFRWNAGRSLALARMSTRGRVPPIFQRARSDDLLAAVFPDQVACQDNRGGGDIAVPDHPLVHETLSDCLHEVMDVEGLKAILLALKAGRIEKLAVDLPTPSPLAHSLLNAMPWAFLDDAPLEERRARAVSLRRVMDPEDAAAFGALDAEVIQQVISDVQMPERNADELHEALLQWVMRPAAESSAALRELLAQRRVARVELEGRSWWVAAERLSWIQHLFPGVSWAPPLPVMAGGQVATAEEAAAGLVQGQLEMIGPTTSRELQERLPLGPSVIEMALVALELKGHVLRGQFRPDTDPSELEWCDRRLLRRIHRLTIGKLRAEIQPLTAADFMRFLFRWHHMEPGDHLRGSGGVLQAIRLLQGFEAPAVSWEEEMLAARVEEEVGEDLLEDACWSGEVVWGRLTLREVKSRMAYAGRHSLLSFVLREDMGWLLAAARPEGGEEAQEGLSHPAMAIVEVLSRRGAVFFADLVAATRRLPAEIEDGLRELVTRGLVSADGIQNLRTLHELGKSHRRPRRRGGPGRWTLLQREPVGEAEVLEKVARLLLHRYGIVWRDLLVREALARPWREMLAVYRRLEARGEIRGGRFVAGFTGEQFALLEVVESARKVRREGPRGVEVKVPSCDPLNLTGVVTAGPRIPSQVGQIIRYIDGVPQRDLLAVPSDPMVSAG